MLVTLHEDPAKYEEEYARVRAHFVAAGTSLNQWLQERGITRQTAYNALRGKSQGRRAIAIRREILRATLFKAP